MIILGEISNSSGWLQDLNVIEFYRRGALLSQCAVSGSGLVVAHGRRIVLLKTSVRGQPQFHLFFFMIIYLPCLKNRKKKTKHDEAGKCRQQNNRRERTVTVLQLSELS